MGPVTLIDVRLTADHTIAGAQHVPVTDLEDNPRLWDARTPLVVFCQYGRGGSDYAAEVLEEQGYSDVWKLAGGLSAWEKWREERAEGK